MMMMQQALIVMCCQDKEMAEQMDLLKKGLVVQKELSYHNLGPSQSTSDATLPCMLCLVVLQLVHCVQFYCAVLRGSLL